MINVLVKKLPAKVAQDWAKHKQKEKISNMASEDVFKELMDFLKAEKEVTKDLLHKAEHVEKAKTHTSYVTGQTFVAKSSGPVQASSGGKKGGKLEPYCIACDDNGHWTTGCDKWKSLKLADRQALVKCQRHIQAKSPHKSTKCQAGNMSKFYNNGVFSKQCGIC